MPHVVFSFSVFHFNLSDFFSSSDDWKVKKKKSKMPLPCRHLTFDFRTTAKQWNKHQSFYGEFLFVKMSFKSTLSFKDEFMSLQNVVLFNPTQYVTRPFRRQRNWVSARLDQFTFYAKQTYLTFSNKSLLLFWLFELFPPLTL